MPFSILHNKTVVVTAYANSKMIGKSGHGISHYFDNTCSSMFLNPTCQYILVVVMIMSS